MINPLDVQPFQIGPVTVQSRVLLAPMAGVTDVVFRALVRYWAPESLICTEMISSNGIVFSKRGKGLKKDAMILDKTEMDWPIAYQLAANREDILIEAAKDIIADKNPATIDLNMGCPVKKITGNFEGCSLMREPERAYKLITALVREIDTPVTVKFRLGWDLQSMNYLEFGQMCEDAGAKMVVLHARTRSQGYQPGCKWEAFGELKAALQIPVVANGDINTWEDARTVLETYGVDGVMIGRGCLGEPWLLGQIDQALKTGTPPEHIPLAQRLAWAYTHALRHCEYKGPEIGIREIRKHLAWYLKDFPGASRYRSAVTQVNSLPEVRAIFDDILGTQSATFEPLESLAMAV